MRGLISKLKKGGKVTRTTGPHGQKIKTISKKGGHQKVVIKHKGTVDGKPVKEKSVYKLSPAKTTGEFRGSDNELIGTQSSRRITRDTKSRRAFFKYGASKEEPTTIAATNVAGVSGETGPYYKKSTRLNKKGGLVGKLRNGGGTDNIEDLARIKKGSEAASVKIGQDFINTRKKDIISLDQQISNSRSPQERINLRKQRDQYALKLEREKNRQAAIVKGRAKVISRQGPGEGKIGSLARGKKSGGLISKLQNGGKVRDLVNKVLKREVTRYPEDEYDKYLDLFGGTRKEIITPRKGIVKTTDTYGNKAKTKIKGKNLTKEDLKEAELQGESKGDRVGMDDDRSTKNIVGSEYPLKYKHVRKKKGYRARKTTDITKIKNRIIETKSKDKKKGEPAIKTKTRREYKKGGLVNRLQNGGLGIQSYDDNLKKGGLAKKARKKY